jgi:uncharacterized membrane protein YfcA
VVFITVTEVAWKAAGIIAAGSILGGMVGATVGRRLPSPALRGFVALIGLIAIINLVFLD